VADADLLVHVVDASSADPEGQMTAVHEVLREIDADMVPELLIFNKSDKAKEAAEDLSRLHPGSVVCSALTGEGMVRLLERLSEVLRATDRTLDLVVPYDRGDILAALHRSGEVIQQTDAGGQLALRVRLDESTHRRFAEFMVRNDHVSDRGAPVDEETE
jgi:GTP-binding protein HflX